jgi:hopanoid biosynthesis associated RND transporter like protein HpnN
MQTVRRTAADLGIDAGHDLRVRLTGDIAMEFEELQSVTRGAKMAGLLSLVMVSIVLFAGLRSFKLVSAALITLIFGLIWTAGFAALTVGHLNMISVAFAVLFIGLAVDFAIHFCLRGRELLLAGNPLSAALPETARDVGSSLVLCAVTTAIGFYAFIPTDFSGVAELGLISGTGMFIGLIANLTVLPALLTVMRFRAAPQPAAAAAPGRAPRQGILAFAMRHSRVVRVAALLAGLGSIALLPRIGYDRNPLNLRDPSSESVATFREMLAQDDHSPWSLKVLAPDRAAAEKAVSRLKSVKGVKAAVTIDDFVPADQPDKLDIIEDIQYIVGPSLVPGQPAGPGPDPAEKLSAVETFSRRLSAWIKINGAKLIPTSPARQLAHELKLFLIRVETTDAHRKKQLLGNLSASLLGSLPGRLESLQLSLEAAPFGIRDLPADLVRRWVTPDGRYRVEILPRQDLNNNRAMLNFINTVTKIEPDATGYPVVIHEGSLVVARAFKKAFTLSLAAIVLLLLVLMPKKSDAFLVLLSLVLSALFTGACMALFKLSLNFANIIALPLILGIGVDNGIHMVHRYHTVGRNPQALLHSSTVRGIVFATLTTICSFGNLAVSPHLGMASMGKLLTIGIGASLLSTLVILPAFFPKAPEAETSAVASEMETA